MANRSDKPKGRSFLQNLELVLKRFGQDLLGILMISSGAVSLLNMFNITRGKFIDQWVDSIQSWFGWGSYLLALLFVAIGLITLLRHFEKSPRLDLKHIILLELTFFVICAMLAAVGGYSVENASAGIHGGIVGWGLARFMRNVFGDVLTQIILILSSLIFLYISIDRRKRLAGALDIFFEQALLSSPMMKIKGQESNLQNADRLDGTNTRQNIHKASESTGFEKKALPPLSILLDNTATLTDESYIHSKAIRNEKSRDNIPY